MRRCVLFDFDVGSIWSNFILRSHRFFAPHHHQAVDCVLGSGDSHDCKEAKKGTQGLWVLLASSDNLIYMTRISSQRLSGTCKEESARGGRMLI